MAIYQSREARQTCWNMSGVWSIIVIKLLQRASASIDINCQACCQPCHRLYTEVCSSSFAATAKGNGYFCGKCQTRPVFHVSTTRINSCCLGIILAWLGSSGNMHLAEGRQTIKRWGFTSIFGQADESSSTTTSKDYKLSKPDRGNIRRMHESLDEAKMWKLRSGKRMEQQMEHVAV